MKKNSFKRFLAVTLAAATALTFAPVSTLGLYGVVEAQAAITGVAAKGVSITTSGDSSAAIGTSDDIDVTVTTDKNASVTDIKDTDTANALLYKIYRGRDDVTTNFKVALDAKKSNNDDKTEWYAHITPDASKATPGTYTFVVYKDGTITDANAAGEVSFTVNPVSVSAITAPSTAAEKTIAAKDTNASAGEFEIDSTLLTSDTIVGKTTTGIPYTNLAKDFGITVTASDGTDVTDKVTFDAKTSGAKVNTAGTPAVGATAAKPAETYFTVANSAAYALSAGTYTITANGKSAQFIVSDTDHDLGTKTLESEIGKRQMKYI